MSPLLPQSIDALVVPMPKENVAKYRRIARAAGKVWIEHSELEYRECVGNDLDVTFGTPIPKGVRLKPGETAMFSWIVYKSRAYRDRVNAKVMKAPRFASMIKPKAMPFDCKRMIYGGFKTIVLF